MIHVSCRLTAKNRDQLQDPTLVNRVWATFTFTRPNFLGGNVVGEITGAVADFICYCIDLADCRQCRMVCNAVCCRVLSSKLMNALQQRSIVGANFWLSFRPC